MIGKIIRFLTQDLWRIRAWPGFDEDKCQLRESLEALAEAVRRSPANLKLKDV